MSVPSTVKRYIKQYVENNASGDDARFNSIGAGEVYTTKTIEELQSRVQSGGDDYVKLQKDTSFTSDSTLSIDASEWAEIDRDVTIVIPYWEYTGSGRAIEIKNNDDNSFQGRVTLKIGKLFTSGGIESGTRAVTVEDFTSATIDYGAIYGFDYGVYGNIVDSQCENLHIVGKKIRFCNYNVRLEGDGPSGNVSFVDFRMDTTLSTENTALYADEVMLADSIISGASFTSNGQTGWYLNLNNSGLRASTLNWRFDGPGGTDINLQTVPMPASLASFAFKNSHTNFNDPNGTFFPHFREDTAENAVYDRGTKIRQFGPANQRTYAYNSSDQTGLAADGTFHTMEINSTEIDTYGQSNASNNSVDVEFGGEYSAYAQIRITGINDGDIAELEIRVNGTRQSFKSEQIPDFGTIDAWLPAASISSGGSIDVRVSVTSSNANFSTRGVSSESYIYVQQIS